MNNDPSPDFTFAYDALSRRTSLTRPNGITTSYAYNPQSWLNSVLHKNGRTTLDGATYTYDVANNRLSKQDNRTATTTSYTYDHIYQLLTAKQGTTTKESYTYDIVGNRLSSLGVSPYTYNSSNELMTLPSGSYTYDKNGNTLTKPDGTQFTWDLENRLTQAVLPGSSGTLNFKYDPFGRRIQKVFTQGSTTTTTNYLYDGMNVIEELDNSDTSSHYYTITISETTMFNPSWTTFSPYLTQWGLQNTTGATVHAVLTVKDAISGGPYTKSVTIAAGSVAFITTNSTFSGGPIPANHNGNAILTHDGPPGAILANTYIISSTVVFPAEFRAVRENNH